MPPRIRDVIVVLTALMTCVSLAGCGPSAEELAEERRLAREAKIKKLESAPVWVGEVKGYKGIWDDLLVLDYGGEYDAEIDLAHIIQIDECEPYDLVEGAEKAYTKYIQDAAPIGSRIAVLRSRLSYDHEEFDNEKGMVITLEGQADPDLNAKSLNERMISDGVAVPDPFADPDYGESLSDLTQGQKSDMAPEDFAQWQTIVDAYVRAFKKRVGWQGKCTIAAEKAAIKAKKEEKRDEREYRRWELGPDGRRGTGDDYTYGDERDGSDGGSFNVPGWMCPTRFC